MTQICEPTTELTGLRRFVSSDLLAVKTNDSQKESLNELHLFAGGGGGILGGILLGHTCVCAVEIEPYARQVLLARQRDGILPRFPIWDDIRTFDGNPWRGIVRTVCGGFPCQDISSCGNGAGIEGERSGLWGEMCRIIGEIRPENVFVENSPALTFRGLGRVLGDLAGMGYDAAWCVLGHDSFGGQHSRKRIWIAAHSDEGTVQQLVIGKRENIEQRQARIRRKNWVNFLVENDGTTSPSWRYDGQETPARPIMRRDSDGVADGMDRIAAIGNGQVPIVAAYAWQTLGVLLPPNNRI